jgi:hypothetical protein
VTSLLTWLGALEVGTRHCAFELKSPHTRRGLPVWHDADGLEAGRCLLNSFFFLKDGASINTKHNTSQLYIDDADKFGNYSFKLIAGRV